MKIRWFDIKPFSAASLQKLAEAMLKAKYDEKAGYGFNLDDVRKGYITGRHIEKELISRTFHDPQGHQITSSIEFYRTTSFTFRNNGPHLEIGESSRHLSELLSSIGDFLDNKVAIKPIEATIPTWLSALRGRGALIEVSKIVTRSVSLSNSTSVKAAFVGRSDVEQQMQSLFTRREVEPESITATVQIDDHTAKFRISSMGMFRFAGVIPEPVINLFREVAADIVRNDATK